MKTLSLLLGLFFLGTLQAAAPETVSFTWKGRGAEQMIELQNGKISTTSWQHKTESFEAGLCHKKIMLTWHKRLTHPRMLKKKSCPGVTKNAETIQIKTGQITLNTSPCTTLAPTHQQVLAELLACK